MLTYEYEYSGLGIQKRFRGGDPLSNSSPYPLESHTSSRAFISVE